VVRAAAGKLTRACRSNPKHRAARKAFYREMLASHAQAQDVVQYFQL
jgi:hypothetical protein